jgi:hypothetical protein
MKTLLLSLALLTGGSASASIIPSVPLQPVSIVNELIHVGSGRAAVHACLGTPYASLPNGIWLYRGFNAPGATGGDSTLVVGFEGHKVTSLALTTESGAVALRATAEKSRQTAGRSHTPPQP